MLLVASFWLLWTGFTYSGEAPVDAICHFSDVIPENTVSYTLPFPLLQGGGS